MTQDGAEFRDLMARREAAARAYAAGDATPVLDLTAADGPVTFLDPGGGILEGAEAVRRDFDRGAASFGPSGTTRFEIRDGGLSGDLAWWTGLQIAEVEFRGTEGRVPMRLRVTEVFRRTGEGWRLVHRHASPLREG